MVTLAAACGYQGNVVTILPFTETAPVRICRPERRRHLPNVAQALRPPSSVDSRKPDHRWPAKTRAAVRTVPFQSSSIPSSHELTTVHLKNNWLPHLPAVYSGQTTGAGTPTGTRPLKNPLGASDYPQPTPAWPELPALTFATSRRPWGTPHQLSTPISTATSYTDELDRLATNLHRTDSTFPRQFRRKDRNRTH